MEKGKAQSAEIRKQLESVIEDMLKKMDIATGQDLAELKKEIAELKAKQHNHE